MVYLLKMVIFHSYVNVYQRVLSDDWTWQRSFLIHEYFGDLTAYHGWVGELPMKPPWKIPMSWLVKSPWKTPFNPQIHMFYHLQIIISGMFLVHEIPMFSSHRSTAKRTALGAPRVHWTRASGSFRAPLERLEPRECWSMGFQHDVPSGNLT